MSAVIMRETDLPTLDAFLDALRDGLGKPGAVLAWKNIKGHPGRLFVAREIGRQNWLRISSVVVCKRYLAGLPTEDHAYLYTLRFLMERLSWFARDRGEVLRFTLAHIVRFQLAKLRDYESRLHADPTCKIAWAALDGKGGRIDQPRRVPGLQLADLAASGTGAAFNIDDFGNTEPRYLHEMSPALYRRGSSDTRLTSYGLKMHPWNDATKATYPWVAAL